MRCCSPLPWFVATTEAPGMTEPEASRTKPEICPESNCASVIVADTDDKNTTARILRNMISSQVIDLNQRRSHRCCGKRERHCGRPATRYSLSPPVRNWHTRRTCSTSLSLPNRDSKARTRAASPRSASAQRENLRYDPSLV